jgi:hypothetical protein
MISDQLIRMLINDQLAMTNRSAEPRSRGQQ